MRPVSLVLALLLLAPLPALAAPPAGSPTYQVVLPRRAVSAGERIDLKVVPPPPPGAGVTWVVWLTAGEGMVLPGGIYWAPYLVPVGAPPAKVTVQIRNGTAASFATGYIELRPGSVPGVEDCLGAGQTFSDAAAALTPSGVPPESGGYVVQSVDPVYPRSAFVRGISDTIAVLALVCKTGRVLDAHYAPTYAPSSDPFSPDPTTLIEHDPKLVEAAVDAVRQYEFAPEIVNGQAVAFGAYTTVILRPPSTSQIVETGRLKSSVSFSPNPMNPNGLLIFSTSIAGRVRVMLFDVQGRRIGTLLDLAEAAAGIKKVPIGGTAAVSGRLATGIYFYRIETTDGTATGRFVVMK